MNIIKTVAVFIVLLWWGLAAQALAYPSAESEEPEKWDPKEQKGMDVKILGAVTHGYDTNITYVRDDPEDDRITVTSVGVDLKYRTKTESLDLKAGTFHQFFAESHRFDNTGADLDLDYKKEFSATDQLRVKDIYSYTSEPRSFKDAFGRSAGRYKYFLNRFVSEYVHEFQKQISGLVKYANEYYHPERKDIAGSDQNKIGVELDYAYNSETTLLGAFDYASREFKPGRAINIQTASVGIKRLITRQLELETRVGVDLLSHSDRDVTEPQFMVILRNKLIKTLEGEVLYLNKHDSNAFTEDIFDFWQVAWSLSKHLDRRTKVALSHFYGEGEYSITNDKETFQGARIGISYEFSDRWRSEAIYTFENVGANNNSREYDKNTFYIGMTREF